jgi:hypothetical protein
MTATLSKQFVELPRTKAQSDRVPRTTTADAPQTVEEVSRYVGQMCGEMASLARTSRLDVLAYFLEMARIEAASISLKSRAE